MNRLKQTLLPVALVSAALMLTACKPTFEFAIGLKPPAFDNAADTTYTDTQYPIVLVHGMFGFGDILGINYFYQVPQALEAGGATVLIPTMSSLAGNELRGEQLLAQLQDYKANLGHQKFNLIAHSHGSPTARYVASVAPELVASISTAGGVNAMGSEKAALLNDRLEGFFSSALLQPILNTMGLLIDAAQTPENPLPQVAKDAFYTVGFEGAAAFNLQHPQGLPTVECGQGPDEVNGVNYYSWGGIAIATNSLDPTDRILQATADLYEPGESDGTMNRCATHLGKVIRDDYFLNHTDLSNQALGLRHPTSTNPLNIYRAHANRMKTDGL
ncbi:Triacylglycerol lipase [BD1-7 clade bacterium]|uniref:Triacylglycerol lipase n=1 Tax=BD1-7 clade bacterium TaxID=2029982 RepID=A0A5S9PES4_9GAMM|nr:Triacylglycerol lipase [BD1-7 clade bacterium]CAA0102105.1 Triacylglycerol lipase [BD1-7 clade bacterium]